MKILIVNTSDIQGGAARAAYRLHLALREENIESQMLVQDKRSDDDSVISIISTYYERFLHKIRARINFFPQRFYKHKNKALFSPAITGSNIVDKINIMAPDIVHLHWIGSGLIKIEDIARIHAPIVWSLHDMWAFTGGCHYDEGCGGFEQDCGNCKILGSNSENDLSRKVFHRKMQVYSKINNMTVVGLSSWINKTAQTSTLLQNKKHINLPNPINTSIFTPFDKHLSRKSWNLPEGRKLVLFGAMEATNDPRKGFIELNQALQRLIEEEIELVVFGNTNPVDTSNFNFRTHDIGQFTDDIKLATLYSAVDVMIVPSLQENLSNAIVESLACGTPVVCFDIGGNKDIVSHKINGYLAKPYDIADLSNGIKWILNSKNYNELSIHAREKIVTTFDSKIVVKQYIKLYNETINNV